MHFYFLSTAQKDWCWYTSL